MAGGVAMARQPAVCTTCDDTQVYVYVVDDGMLSFYMQRMGIDEEAVFVPIVDIAIDRGLTLGLLPVNLTEDQAAAIHASIKRILVTL